MERSEFQIILQHVNLILVLINCSSIFTNQNIASLLDLMTSVHMFCSSVFTKQNRNVIIRFNDIYPHNRFSQYPSVLLYTTSLNSSLKLCRWWLDKSKKGTYRHGSCNIWPCIQCNNLGCYRGSALSGSFIKFPINVFSEKRWDTFFAFLINAIFFSLSCNWSLEFSLCIIRMEREMAWDTHPSHSIVSSIWPSYS